MNATRVAARHGGPSAQWLDWANRWDARRHYEPTEREQAWRALGEAHPWDRGSASHADDDGTHPWMTTTDTVTITPAAAARNAIHRHVADSTARALARREQVADDVIRIIEQHPQLAASDLTLTQLMVLAGHDTD